MPPKNQPTRAEAIAFILIWSTITVLALAWGLKVDFYDDSHVQYGFPLVWAVHQLVTIAGPVDTWYFDSPALLINITFWLGTMMVSVVALRYFLRARRIAET